MKRTKKYVVVGTHKAYELMAVLKAINVDCKRNKDWSNLVEAKLEIESLQRIRDAVERPHLFA